MKKGTFPSPHLDPAQQLCPEFDETSVKTTLTRERQSMGIPIFDNCAEEHIQ